MKDMQGNSNGGHASKCGGCDICDGRHGQHHWMHLVVKVAIAIFIFWAGVQFGEIKGALRSAYPGYGMMSGWYGQGDQVYQGAGMMSGWTYKGAAEPIATSSTKK